MATTSNFFSLPVPADNTPEFSAKLTQNILQLQDTDSLASNFPGIPDATNTSSPFQLGNFLNNGVNLPSYMPSSNVTGIADFAGQAATIAGQQPLDTGAISNLASTLALSENSVDPFASFELIEQAKNIACNFQTPTVSLPNFDNMFNININDIGDKLNSLLPKFTGPSSINVGEFLTSAVKSVQQTITSTFKSFYNKLFTCQSAGDQSV